MHWLDFVAAIGATGAIVNAWLHRGGLFEEWRAKIALWGEPSESHQYRPLRQKVAQLLQCRVCLSYHVAFWLLLLFFIVSHWLSPSWVVGWRVPVYALAATRFSLLVGSVVAAFDIENDPELDD